VINVESIAKIRHRYYVKGEKISRIARSLNIARNTVKRVLRSEEPTKTYKRVKEVENKLSPYVEELNRLLEDNAKEPVKGRYTAKRIYQVLKEHGYEGAYDSVQRFVKTWRKNNGSFKAKGYVPLYFAPGEAYQFDWSTESVTIGDVAQTIHVAHIRLCYSRFFLVVAYQKESQEMLFDAHVKAFQFFNVNPTRGIYDNLKTGIDTIFTGKERRFNRRFLMMLSHYLIDPTACTPCAGWEKGQVENQVGNIREWLFMPKLSFNTLNELNEWLKESCLKLAQARKHPEQKERTIFDVFTNDEQRALRSLAPKFDGYIEREVAVSSTCLVRFDHNRYSVDCRYAKQTVSLRYYADRIEIFADNENIGTHARNFDKNKTIYDPWHYVPLLERKPGALRNGAPFKDWELPDSLQKVRVHLMARLGGDGEFVDILQAIQVDGLEAVVVASELALSEEAISADYILNALSRLRPTPTPIVISTTDQLQLANEPISNCQRYNSLLSCEVSQ